MLRFGFVTCVRLGEACMRAIYEVGGRLEAACTLQDDSAPHKAGRVYIEDFCAARGIRLAKVRDINDGAALKFLREAALDWLFIVGWSQIAHPEVLSVARFGALGMHPTLLPIGRGRASIPWAIIRGLSETGVTLFKLDEGVDTGPIAAQELITIDPTETASSLYAKIETAHSHLLRRSWHALAAGSMTFRAQEAGLATYWPGRKPEDGRIDRSMSFGEAERLVRAVTRPYPGAFVDVTAGRLRIWSVDSRPAQLADGVVQDSAGGWLVPVADGSLRVLEGAVELAE